MSPAQDANSVMLQMWEPLKQQTLMEIAYTEKVFSDYDLTLGQCIYHLVFSMCK